MQVTGIEGSSFHRERGEQRRKGTSKYSHHGMLHVTATDLILFNYIGDQQFSTVKMMINENSKEELDTLFSHEQGSAMVGPVIPKHMFQPFMMVCRSVCTAVDPSLQPYFQSSPVFQWLLP